MISLLHGNTVYSVQSKSAFFKKKDVKFQFPSPSFKSTCSSLHFSGREIELAPGSPLILTHKIKLVPSGLGSGSGSCSCEMDFAALRERVERLEREVSALREKCGGVEGGCCTSKESKGSVTCFSLKFRTKQQSYQLILQRFSCLFICLDTTLLFCFSFQR